MNTETEMIYSIKTQICIESAHMQIIWNLQFSSDVQFESWNSFFQS